MCLLAIANQVDREYPLIVPANRDEFLDRPASPMHYWPDAPHILAGRDLRAGGTWFGISIAGNFAAITNHRDMRRPLRHGPSRGALVRAVLDDAQLPDDTHVYDGFNLIHGNWRDLHYHNNVNGDRFQLEPGIHGLSNAFLNTPWPKVQRARTAMAGIAAQRPPAMEELFALLADETPVQPAELPDTGIGPEWEMALSPVMISTEGYGTRCSTVLIVDRNGNAVVEERTFSSNGKQQCRFELLLK